MKDTYKTLIGRAELAERWGFDSTSSIINYENEGVLTRNPNFKVPRYYMEEVMKIEALKEINPLSPIERKRLENQIKELKKERDFYKSKMQEIRMLIVS